MRALNRIFKGRGRDAQITLPAKIRKIFSKYGANAHLYLFGPPVPILGPELVVNGDGASLDGWTVAQDVGSVTVVGGALSLTKASAGTNTSVRQVLNTVAGKLYRLKYETKSSTGAYNVTCQTSVGYSTAVGSLGFDFVAASNGTALIVEQGTVGPATSVFDNISVREILGYSNTYSGFTAGNYFDSSGTTPASVDGSVGLVLDAAGSVGPELVNAPASWGLLGDGGANIVINTVQASVAFNGSESSYSGFSCTGNVVSGKTYRANFTVSGRVAGQVQLQCGGFSSPFINANGSYSYIFTATGTLGATIKTDANIFNGVVSSIYLKEVTGIHATQATPGYKPTERKGIVNLLNNSNPTWTIVHGVTGTCTITTGQPDPYGGNTAQRIAAVSNGDYALAQTSIGSSLTGVYTGGLMVKSATGSNQTFTIWTDNVAAINVTATQDWQIVAATQNVTANTLFKVMGGDILVARIGLFAGTLTAAQIIEAGGIPLTTTAPASSQAGPNYLEFDGVDDRLSSTGSFAVGSGATFVFAGMLPALGAYRFLFGQEANGCSIFIGPNGEVGLVQTTGGGVFSSNGIIVAGQVFVLTLKLSVSGGVAAGRIHKNGVIATSGSFSLNTGAFASGNFNLFADSAVGASFKGRQYLSCIIADATISVQDVAVIEKQAAAAAGIQL